MVKKAIFILFIFAMHSLSYAAPSASALVNINSINKIVAQITESKNIDIKDNIITVSNLVPDKIMTITVNDNNNVTMTGTIDSNETAESLIENIAGLKTVNDLSINGLSLPNGSPISRSTMMIGFTKGFWSHQGLFDSPNAGPKPSLTVMNDILFMDGTVNNLFILSRTIIAAQQVSARKLSIPMRVLSRMTIRHIKVNN